MLSATKHRGPASEILRFAQDDMGALRMTRQGVAYSGWCILEPMNRRWAR